MTTLTHDITALLTAALESPQCDTTRGALADAMQERDCWNREMILPWVIAHRDNDAPRLLFARWCDANGEEARGEFVRVQVELGKRDRWLDGDKVRYTPCPEKLQTADYKELRRRERELLPIVARGFLGDILGWHTHCRVINHNEVQYDSAPGNTSPQDASIIVTPARGFVQHVECHAVDWLTHADAITREQPITQTRLSTRPTVWTFDHGLKMFRLDGREIIHQFPDLIGEPYTEDEIIERLLEKEWPDIHFELPSHAAAEMV